MAPITKPLVRPIVDDFAEEIRRRKTQTAKPSTDVINFRTERRDNKEREIVLVPIGLLRFRKDNGRISSDVADHENNIGPLDERDERTQQVLAKFLDDKDPEQTGILRKSILHSGQERPAIITCDGFLINGNRRKLVLDQLHRELPENDTFGYMKAVILPGPNDEGGPPTLLEIEKLENRYQLQSDGKSEYYGFDRALSIQRKIALGLSLRDQLRDDPRYAGTSEADLEKAEKEVYKKFLKPLDCANRYLKQFNRTGQYRTISRGMTDSEGRWQAFVDYSDVYSHNFANPKRRAELGIDEDDIGLIEEAAFDIIRLRHVPDMPKVHTIMRNLPKYCGSRDGKKEIVKIAEEVHPTLPPGECRDKDGKHLSVEEIDAKWNAKHQQVIIYRLKKASKTHETQKERETPLDLLDAAYKKLTHDDMDPGSLNATDCHHAMELAAKIEERARELVSEFYHLEKSRKKFLRQSTNDD